MNKQPDSTFSKTINASRSCYITVKRFAFLSAEAILSRTIDNPNNMLNWFWTLFKNVTPLTKRQKKRNSFDRQKEYFAPGKQTRVEDNDNGFYRGIAKVFLRGQSLPEHFVFGQYASPMKLIELFSYPQWEVNAPQIVLARNYFVLFCNVPSVFVLMVILQWPRLTVSVRINWLPFSSSFLIEKTQNLLFPKGNVKGKCLFGYSIYRCSDEQRNCLLTLEIKRQF